MKKYSQSAHHTLNELNITLLLDLAFVLLVIFIITTTPAVNDIDISLPDATSRPKDSPPQVNYVTVGKDGRIFLNLQQMDEEMLLKTLVQFRQADPNINIVVRGDAGVEYQRIIGVLDILVSANVNKVGLATDAVAGR